jgi:hypothetical protein
MQVFRSARWFFLALLLCLVPASSFAGVFISVGFAPPVLPVYEQPLCPEPGLMWEPGYWAYGPDGYYWVPGAWVPAPYEGALWTPPYWGWSGGLFMFHEGYWGPHVGYYGGVNYGFGYMGIGFVGGRWHGHDFEYNRAVMRVDETRIRNVYEDRTIVNRYTVVNNNRVSYNGGPNGIRHDPAPEERAAMNEKHMAPTSFQQQHMQAAQSDKGSYFNNNHGRPATVAVARPLTTGARPAGGGAAQGQRGSFNNNSRGGTNPPNQAQPRSVQPSNQGSQPRGNQQSQGYQNRPAPQSRPAPESRPAPQSRPAPESRSAPQSRPAPESRPAPQSRPAQQARPAPQSRPAPAQREEHQSEPKEHKGR